MSFRSRGTPDLDKILDDSLPDLVDNVSNSESEDEPERDGDHDNFLEVDSNVYVWSPVKLTSLSRSKRELVRKMISQNYLEYDESSNPPAVQSIWKVDGLS